MPRRRDLTAKVRIVGLVSSFVAVAAIGLTVVGRQRIVWGGWIGYPTRTDFPAGRCRRSLRRQSCSRMRPSREGESH